MKEFKIQQKKMLADINLMIKKLEVPSNNSNAMFMFFIQQSLSCVYEEIKVSKTKEEVKRIVSNLSSSDIGLLYNKHYEHDFETSVAPIFSPRPR